MTLLNKIVQDSIRQSKLLVQLIALVLFLLLVTIIAVKTNISTSIGFCKNACLHVFCINTCIRTPYGVKTPPHPPPPPHLCMHSFSY